MVDDTSATVHTLGDERKTSMLIDTLPTAIAVYEARSAQGEFQMIYFKPFPKEHPHRKALVRLNILLRQVAQKDDQRLFLVSRLVGREIHSTYDLTVGEVQAVLMMAY